MRKVVFSVGGAIVILGAIVKGTAEVLIPPFAYGGEVELVDFGSRVCALMPACFVAVTEGDDLG